MGISSHFAGRWSDKTGKTLIISQDGQGLEVGFCSASGEPASRKMATGECVPTTGMTASIEGMVLVVELGTDGVGATLWLTHSEVDGQEHLLPEIEHGLYGDNELDFGVPWLFPLEVYSRCK